MHTFLSGNQIAIIYSECNTPSMAQGIHGTSYNIQVRLREFAAMDGSAVCYGNWARFILYESINEKWNIVKSNS